MNRYQKLVLLSLVAGLHGVVQGQQRVSVEQLEQVTASLHGEHDGSAALRLSGLQLTERLSEVRLEKISADLAGPEARKSLTLLADASAFMSLPASELPAIPPPDRAAQIVMLTRARGYVVKTLTKLPNFFATRETSNFVSRPGNARINSVNTIRFEPFQEADSSSITVLYRDGHELVADKKRLWTSAHEVRTVGEFGPILAVVWNDAAKGHIIWSHWEQTTTGPEAVFHFSVPQPASHYSVNFPGMGQQIQHYPAYHGEMTLNPLDGSILRITLIADLDPNDAMTSAGLLVGYAPTDIGGVSYICPVKSIALANVKEVLQNLSGDWGASSRGSGDAISENSKELGDARVYLNEVLFTHYHIFRSESRILADDEEPSQHSAPEAPADTPSLSKATPGDTVDHQAHLPATGTRLTVAEFEEAMKRERTDAGTRDLSLHPNVRAGSTDDGILALLSRVQLTERLSAARLTRLQGYFSGPRVRETLDALADRAAFLELPESDLPRTKPPDPPALAAIETRMNAYVQQIAKRLPDLSVSRQIAFFEDEPVGRNLPNEGLHRVRAMKDDVTYSDGHEMAKEKRNAKNAVEIPTTMGEFRGILETVISDSAAGEIGWDHWEQGATGLQAVFAYSVPKELSHLGGLMKEDADKSGLLTGLLSERGYHGEIAVDPANGTILRITIIIELRPADVVSIANFFVEYDATRIGDTNCVCPTRSVAIVVTADTESAGDPAVKKDSSMTQGPRRTYIQEAVFEKYRISKN